MKYVGTNPNPAKRYFKVKDREEPGLLIQAGKNIGGEFNVYAYVLYFESTGEVCYYDQGAIEEIRD